MTILKYLFEEQFLNEISFVENEKNKNIYQFKKNDEEIIKFSIPECNVDYLEFDDSASIRIECLNSKNPLLILNKLKIDNKIKTLCMDINYQWEEYFKLITSFKKSNARNKLKWRNDNHIFTIKIQLSKDLTSISAVNVYLPIFIQFEKFPKVYVFFDSVTFNNNYVYSTIIRINKKSVKLSCKNYKSLSEKEFLENFSKSMKLALKDDSINIDSLDMELIRKYILTLEMIKL